eukprot:1149959-Pelagomonas_calceolata.AAC.1
MSPASRTCTENGLLVNEYQFLFGQGDEWCFGPGDPPFLNQIADFKYGMVCAMKRGATSSDIDGMFIVCIMSRDQRWPIAL